MSSVGSLDILVDSISGRSPENNDEVDGRDQDMSADAAEEGQEEPCEEPQDSGETVEDWGTLNSVEDVMSLQHADDRYHHRFRSRRGGPSPHRLSRRTTRSDLPKDRATVPGIGLCSTRTRASSISRQE